MKTIRPLNGQGEVTLHGVFGDELTIVNAARMSFNQESNELTAKDKRLLCYLLDNRHTSPFEQVSVRLVIEAPLPIVRQWERHPNLEIRTPERSLAEVHGRWRRIVDARGEGRSGAEGVEQAGQPVWSR